MTTKKTAAPSFADIVAEADIKAAEKATEARTELVELRDNIARWVDEHTEAAARVNWIRSNYTRGKEVATGQEFAEALATEERLKLLAGVGLEQSDVWSDDDPRITRLERALPPAEKKLAAAVAALLVDVLPGVEILTTFGKVDDRPSESDLPVAIVSQAKPTFDGTRTEREYKRVPQFGGLHLSGDVEVTLYRKPVHRELYPPKVAKALEKHGVELFNAQSLKHGDTVSRSEGEYDIDLLRLSVDKMTNPRASEELRQAAADWTASHNTTLAAPKPISGWDAYVGTPSRGVVGRV